MTVVLTTLMQQMPPAAIAHALKNVDKAPCFYCAAGNTPFKMKRQTIHHFADSGKIVICVAAELKPAS